MPWHHTRVPGESDLFILFLAANEKKNLNLNSVLIKTPSYLFLIYIVWLYFEMLQGTIEHMLLWEKNIMLTKLFI